MKKSAHNLLLPVGEDRWLLANPLYGTADLLSSEEAAAFERGEFGDPALAERGYLVDPAAEQAAYHAAYLDFIRDRESEEIQLFYIPTYACNFACGYCYQETYETHDTEAGPVLDAFFNYVDQAFAGRRKYLTLFGGEPLLPGRTHRAGIDRFLSMARDRSLESAVVTNGYHVIDYLESLSSGAIREVQVTLDGAAEVHDRRRPLKGGGGTFARIVAGVDALLERNVSVNLRVVLDKGNIDQLPLLADTAAERGWTGQPGFKTQLGRNYELHHCSRTPEMLFDRLEMLRQVAGLITRHPRILDFHRPAFHLARILGEEGALPPPNFDACPGAKTEWAFDATGHIYSCTATVGKQGESLGTFYPAVALDEEAVFEWQDRDVLAIAACGDCNARLVCGGGCGALAKNRSGALHGPDCRPVAEITRLGAEIYLHHRH